MAKVIQEIAKCIYAHDLPDLSLTSFENTSRPKTYPADASCLNDFFKEYCTEMRREHNLLCFSEVISSLKEIPLIGNFVFEFEDDEQDVYYADTLISVLVKCFQDTIEQCLECSDGIFRCVVLSRDPDEAHNNLYIRIHFPYCVIDKEGYTKKFRPILLRELSKQNVQDHFIIHPNNSWSEALKDFTEYVPLYGSRTYTLPPLKYRECFKRDQISCELEFDPEDYFFIQQGKCDSSFLEDFVYENNEYDKEILLPLYLSVHFHKAITRFQKSLEKPVKKIAVIEYDSETNPDLSSDDPKTMYTFLSELLGSHRASEKNYWLDVGKSIYNIFGGSSQGLEEWKKFTLRGSIDPEECEELYHTFSGSYLTIKTIGFYAREDDPENYKSWHNAWMSKVISDSLDTTHKTVAESFYRYFWLDMMYSPHGKNGSWYLFNGVFIGHHHSTYILSKITREFTTIYQRYLRDIGNAIVVETNDRVKQNLISDQKRVANLVQKLCNGTFQNQILNFSKQYFIIENFTDIYDSDPFKIACKNVVLEVSENKVIFRSGKPEDYITLCTGINYPINYTWDNKYVKDVIKIFKQMTVGDYELGEFLWKLNASFLRGRNYDKIFPICTGEGDNGKSIYNKFLQYAFGKYSVDLPAETIASKGGRAGEARADLAQARGTRVATVMEPSGNAIQSNVVKKYTGNDRNFARGLYESGCGMEQLYTLMLLCNDIPDFSEKGRAISERVCLICFLACFCHDAPETEEEQYKTRKFPCDDTLENRIPELAPAFLWICVQYFPKYIKDGLRNRPDIIIKANEEHWKDTDPYLRFITERMVKTGSTQNSVSISEVCSEFKTWYLASYSGGDRKNTNHDIVKSQMKQQKRLGPHNDERRWVGWKFRDES